MTDHHDTIVAIATPPGTGAVAVIRVSGSKAINVVNGLLAGDPVLSKVQSRKAYLRKIHEALAEHSPTGPADKRLLDEALVTVFRAPNSFTGEDVVEIACHGGEYLSSRILELLIKQGARIAERGEFSLRAFLNGKIDLSKAEAVADIISARTECGLQVALAQYSGGIKETIERIRAGLVAACSSLELDLDFSEEDVEFSDKEKIVSDLKSVLVDLETFLATYARGRILREGVRLVIAGKPNVGKSSLLNTLLRHERAIVTNIPGTTRDVIEEQLDLQGVLFRIVDTAGLRRTEDPVEQEGVNRATETVADADIVLFVLDASLPLDEQDYSARDLVFSEKQDLVSRPVLIALNKIDVGQTVSASEVETFGRGLPSVTISAKEAIGISALENVLIELSVGVASVSQGDVLISNIRQKEAVERARAGIEEAISTLNRGLSGEFTTIGIRDALDSLAEILGEVSSEDILDEIFSKFCIGK